jgi:hypothetical protein
VPPNCQSECVAPSVLAMTRRMMKQSVPHLPLVPVSL